MLNAVKGVLSGIKWPVLGYKLAVYGVIVAAVATLSYREGLSDCKIASRDAQITELNASIVTERENVREALADMHAQIARRLAKMDQDDARAEKLTAELKDIEEVIRGEYSKRTGNGCVPTADELRAWDALAERTRSRGRD